MQQVRDWILKEGRLIADPLDFVNQLADRINNSGLQLDRIRIGFQTIHPQLDIWAYIWSSDTQKSEAWGGEHGIRATASYYGSPAEWVHQHHKTFRRRLDNLDPDKDHNVLFDQAALGLIDYVMIPLDFTDNSVAILAFATKRKSGFTDQEIADLEDLVGYIGPIIEIHATRKIANTLLDTYVGHRSGTRVMNGQIRRGDNEKIEAAVWFSDLRNFTAQTETMDQLQLFTWLNSYFLILSDVTRKHGGEILKFLGDGVLVIFPVDDDITPDIACTAALEAAKEALERAEAENKERKMSEQPLIKFGLGLHFGEVLYGNVGAPDRLDFTVMGPAVNLTSRIEGVSKEVGHSVVVSREFAAHTRDKLEPIGDYELRGVSEAQKLYALPTD